VEQLYRPSPVFMRVAYFIDGCDGGEMCWRAPVLVGICER
jgi:hypothetical protein